MRYPLLTALLFASLTACAPLPIYTSIPVEVRASPNYGERRPNYVILHHTTDDDADASLRTLTTSSSKVSAHYLIGRDGKVYYLVDERMRAWHAGDSSWGGNRDINSSSIGIELDNNGSEPFTEPQITRLIEMLRDLLARWNIPPENVLAHGDVAPGRKVDPSQWFPWRRLADAGVSVWCEPPYEIVDAGLDDATLLAAVGYDVSRLPQAIAAFKRRFAPEDSAPGLTATQRGMAACLVRQRSAR